MLAGRTTAFLVAATLLACSCRPKDRGKENAPSSREPASTATVAAAAVPPKDFTPLFSCNLIKEFSLCEELDAEYVRGVDEKTLRQECVDDHGGKWTKERCPPKGVIGRCKLSAEGGFGQVLYYKGPTPTYDSPQKECRERAAPSLKWTAEYVPP
jgi:hypothetical protein